MTARILGPDGRPWQQQDLARAQEDVERIRSQIRRELKAKYDAAQTFTGNENHWKGTDNLDPHAANSLAVRKKLRVRSRYEIIENNPYLKGAVLTIANDFVLSGPKLQITDKNLTKSQRQRIEDEFSVWCEANLIRQKIWRARIAKLTDGETFMVAYNRLRKRVSYEDIPVGLDFFMLETDRISNSETPAINTGSSVFELDGVRWDRQENPLQYHILNTHPGNNYSFLNGNEGTWVNASQMIHWFRQDRGWLRGIPEITPSLALCALLRRYTLAVVRAAEIAAGFSAIIQTEGPPNQTFYGDNDDNAFDTFDFEHGMITTLPWGYQISQLKAEQPTTMYDAFVDAILREIIRPLLIPFNLGVGSSKDSNMASGILDTHIYKTGQQQERIHANESVLDPMFYSWLREAVKINGYLKVSPNMRRVKHIWRWDTIGIEHTDPTKVQNALKTAHDKGFLTDRDIQEQYHNRSVEEWRDEIAEDIKFRESIGMSPSTPPTDPTQPSPPKKNSSKKPVAAKATRKK